MAKGNQAWKKARKHRYKDLPLYEFPVEAVREPATEEAEAFIKWLEDKYKDLNDIGIDLDLEDLKTMAVKPILRHPIAAHDAINYAAENLPRNYTVELVIENGSAWVELCESDGDRIDYPDSPDNTLAESLVAATDHAVKIGDNDNE